MRQPWCLLFLLLSRTLTPAQGGPKLRPWASFDNAGGHPDYPVDEAIRRYVRSGTIGLVTYRPLEGTGGRDLKGIPADAERGRLESNCDEGKVLLVSAECQALSGTCFMCTCREGQ